MKANKLENLIFSIIESKTKSLMVYVITAVLFALSIYTLPSEIVKAKMLPGKNSDTFSNQRSDTVYCKFSQTRKRDKLFLNLFRRRSTP
jgi:hypothetical protein